MTMWRKTLEYLGLVEEAEEYDELPERRVHNDGDARPAMHDTTGPIDVVRVDSPPVDQGRMRSDHDLTEPVSTVDGGRPSGSSREERRRSRGDGSGGSRPLPTGSRGSTREADNVRQLRPEPAGLSGGLGRRVAIVAVADYEGGAREVGQRYRQSVPVLFDLTDAPNDDRRRVLDFVAGVTYALHGEMVKVGSRSFLIVPQGGEVSDAEWDRLASLGYRA